ncbi:hypothetical protein CFN78_19790 [Amycolatopsis antarctica]|uniref:Uncharacterized protein n=1 Tax=Amycolatopsis antarctica TaxID=1854586 RepID=A0A263D1L6_9PSEU|nr:hypothetical protein [Amycolatopsis antarctica]OZM71406.1 hypothetical protein CFN78_19790 [Amycolatopsis antarctica]
MGKHYKSENEDAGEDTGHGLLLAERYEDLGPTVPILEGFIGELGEDPEAATLTRADGAEGVEGVELFDDHSGTFTGTLEIREDEALPEDPLDGIELDLTLEPAFELAGTFTPVEAHTLPLPRVH